MLILVSKILQNLANELPFELKEGFMLPFNSFITDNIPRVRDFFSQITVSLKYFYILFNSIYKFTYFFI